MTQTYAFVPSRPAPSPPRTAILPHNHPFATYYVPPHLTLFPANNPPPSDARYKRHQSAPVVPTSDHDSSAKSYCSPASAYRHTAKRLPHMGSASSITSSSGISRLAQPLSPRPQLYHTSTGYTTLPDHSTSHHQSPSSPFDLPAELAIFDPRPRQNLLADLETIFGKKIHFPLLSKLSKRVEKSQSEAKSQKAGNGRKRVLRKERERNWEEDFIWREVNDETDRQSLYRGKWI